MLQSKFFDFVLGLDIHIVNVPAPPAPSPIPTPIPMPYVGIVFDPLGLAIGAAINQAVSGNPGIVLINGLPVTNCGTDATNRLSLPHIFAPGVSFTIGVPMGNAELFFGSLNASFAGSFGVRLGDMALSCSDPVRLPTSTVLAIPAGNPVLNMKPMVPDVKAMAMAAVMRRLMRGLGAGAGRVFRAIRNAQRRSDFWTDLAERIHRAADGALDRVNLGRYTDNLRAERLRSAFHRRICQLTGHPVDVATGRVLTDAIDLELPGPLPLKLERSYDSSLSFRSGALGFGWSHSLDQSVWTEPEKVIYQAEDGREIEFQLYDQPGYQLAEGAELYHPLERLTLRNRGQGRWEIETHQGIVHEFGPIIGRRNEAPLLKKRTRDGHAQELFYNNLGLLERVRDTCDREVGFTYDARGYLASILAPNPDGGAPIKHRRFSYSADGDLIEATDALGHSWRYDYDGHLLVQETDRAGLSFYFQYDGRGPFANCVRTWGDGGIYDHEIDYDKANRKTIVTNSLLHATTYEMNRDGLVEKIIDATGGETVFVFDERSFQLTSETDPLGRTTRRTYDDRGNLTSIIEPDGAEIRIDVDPELNVPVAAINAAGNRWSYQYDSQGHLIARVLPTGEATRYEWDGGLVRSITEAGDRRTSITYDGAKNPISVTLANGASIEYEFDRVGRLVATKSPTGGGSTLKWDLEGRAVENVSPVGVVQRARYDGEGNLLESKDETRHIRMRYGHFHKPVEREEAGTTVRFEYSSEDKLTAVVNEAGERYEFERDPLGEVRTETGFDGQRRVYFRDAAGQVEKVLLPSNRWEELKYDMLGRVSEVQHFDGTSERYEYALDGALVGAANDDVEVRFETDALGRVVREHVGDIEVRSQYGANGARELVESSLGARQAALYDELGEVESLHHGPIDAFWRAQISIGRDDLGAEVGRALPNGIELSWELDAASRPTARHTTKQQPGARAIELDARRYQWRGDDQIAAIIDAVRGPRWFDHDGRGRLIRERRPGASPLAGDAAIDRAMDAVGNVYRTPNLSDRRYGPGGRIEQAGGTKYEHDELGNLTTKTEPDGATWRYRWNGAGMLTEVERPDGSRVGFEYDVFARRTKKTLYTVDESNIEGPKDPKVRAMMDLPPAEPDRIVEREVRFVWDGDTVLHELSSDDGLTTWYWQPGSFTPVAKERTGQFWHLTHDHLGTPTEMYDEAGELVWQMSLDIFGEPNFDVGTAQDCPWRWPGQFEDGETGLYYNRWRYLERSAGSYVSKDPIGLFGGIAHYAYSEDTLLGLDPLGLTAKQLRASIEAGERGVFSRAKTPHHIVPENRQGLAQESRALLARNGIDVNTDPNGVPLYGTHPSQVAHVDHPGRDAARSAGDYHAGRHVHGDQVDKVIYRILRAAERSSSSDVEGALRDIGRRMENLTWRESSGCK